MKRSDFPARTKYSWMLRTVDLARALKRRMSSGMLGRVRWGQGMCRVLILPAMPLSISRDRLEMLLAGARNTRVVAVGDAMLDEYLIGDVERISPEAPVPVVRVRERRHALGGAANVAQNIVATGAECRLVTAVGKD